MLFKHICLHIGRRFKSSSTCVHMLFYVLCVSRDVLCTFIHLIILHTVRVMYRVHIYIYIYIYVYTHILILCCFCGTAALASYLVNYAVNVFVSLFVASMLSVFLHE